MTDDDRQTVVCETEPCEATEDETYPDRYVLFPDGSYLPVITLWDNDYEEVENTKDASIILCGSADLGWYELDIGRDVETITVH